jgi:hypothetical protein
MRPVEDCSGGRLAVHIVAGAQVRVSSMRRDESLRLGGDGCEHAVLVKALAVGATSIGGVLETRATDLDIAEEALVSWDCIVGRHSLGGFHAAKASQRSSTHQHTLRRRQ